MRKFVEIKIAVKEPIARVWNDLPHLSAIGRLIDRMVRPGADDPLAALFVATAAEARALSLSEAEIAAELEIYNAERRG